MEAQPCVYILASRRNGTLYTSVTRHPSERIAGQGTPCTRLYQKSGVHRLIYIGLHDTMPVAIKREKQIKRMEEGVEARS